MRAPDQTTPPQPTPVTRPVLLALWFALYGSYTLLTPPLLDDADSVHAEVAREMLLRHDYVTLYANGIRYLEKAPLLYWSMAGCFHLFGVHAWAARLPLAATVLALALLLEHFARNAFRSANAGLYAGLTLLTSFGIFIFTRITIPDAMVCLWLALALYAYWHTEQSPELPPPLPCYVFAVACALNILTKGLIGLVFPLGTVLLHLLLTRGWRRGLQRLAEFHPVTSSGLFLLVAAPWHILIALANPTQGHPAPVRWLAGHLQVPLPTQGNVHGWAWFYFLNEHLFRYLNVRVPRDYDTVPLALFWGLLLVWMMPWSAFLPGALAQVPVWKVLNRARLTQRDRTLLLLGLWAALPMVFFSFSTRQEYYVLPAIPALALLLAGWLADEAEEAASFRVPSPHVTSGIRTATVLLCLGTVAALAAGFLVLHAPVPTPNTDLSTLLAQNPSDYALSFGHFLDLNGPALGAFHDPLTITAWSLAGGTLLNWLLRRNYRPHAANLALAAGATGFLLAAHLALQIFAPVLSSHQLATVMAPLLSPAESKVPDLIILHGEYEAGSTLGFYLRRPIGDPRAVAGLGQASGLAQPIHILDGRSSNLWYGSYFADAPDIFETNETLRQKWLSPRRIFLWQDVSTPLPPLPTQPFFITQSGGKEILSNQPNPY
ncbi:MAG: phospholipid carrier-dependent glycosyltransferase [Acidobacteriota bacterium]|nr:phospholipid carrier-dependent glycosyltransferase [Acidobacteriota bacterium]